MKGFYHLGTLFLCNSRLLYSELPPDLPVITQILHIIPKILPNIPTVVLEADNISTTTLNLLSKCITHVLASCLKLALSFVYGNSLAHF